MSTWLVIALLLVAINVAQVLGIRYEYRRARRRIEEMRR